MSNAAKIDAQTTAATMKTMRAKIDQPYVSQLVANPAPRPTSAIAAALFRSDRVGFDSCGNEVSTIFYSLNRFPCHGIYPGRVFGLAPK
jgi:hypothetical protein